MALLRRLNAEGTTLVIVTHDPEVAAMAHRRIEVSDGRIVADLRGARS
jgi:macrolide transport system ATP-binding/permease protein